MGGTLVFIMFVIVVALDVLSLLGVLGVGLDGMFGAGFVGIFCGGVLFGLLGSGGGGVRLGFGEDGREFGFLI